MKTSQPMIVELEPRTLLSGGHHGGIKIPDPPSATVQADLQKISDDKAKIAADSP